MTKGKAELKDFSFNPKQAIQERQQQRAQKEDQQNRYAEQDYKTQTASGISFLVASFVTLSFQ